MSFRLPCLVAFLRVLAGVLYLAPGYALLAADRETEFVEGLRGRGQHELVLEYLDQAANSAIVSSEFRQRIPYEKGITLLELSRRLPTAERRAEALEGARKELEAFAKGNEGDSQAAEAQAQLAGVLVERARQRMSQADLLPESSKSEREKLLSEARGFIEDARKLYDDVEKQFEGLLAKMKVLDPKTQQMEIDERLELRVRLAQVRVLRSRALYELGQTHGPKSSEFKQHIELAAKELNALYEKYAGQPIGIFALLYEGECYEALEQWKMAMGCYKSLIDQWEADPAKRRYIALAHAYHAKCQIAQLQYEAALNQHRKWLDQSRAAERSVPEWLELAFQLAEAARLQAGTLEEKDRQRPRLLNQARDLYREVSRHAGERQREARLALAGLGRGGGELPQPKTFTEAYTLAKEAISSMSVAQMASKIAQDNNPDALPDLKQQVEDSKAEARASLQQALSLVDDETDLAQLNEVRFLTSWMLWEEEKYLPAATIAKFVAMRYPDDPSAPGAARIALASFDRLQLAAEDDTFAAGELSEVAQFVAQRWPNGETAEAAFNMLLNMALREDRLEDAESLVGRIAEEQRPKFELKLANAMWERLLRADGEQNESARDEAFNLMQSGFAKLRDERPISPTVATAALYMTQVYLDRAQYNDAIALLEDNEVGPLKLLTTDNDVASRPAYAVEAHKAALRAYVSTTPPRSEKAMETMAALERSVEQLGESPGSDRLTRIYVSLGLQLQQQIERFLASGKTQEADSLVAAFATFLDKLNECREDLDWTTKQWICQTYFNLAEGMGDNPADEGERKQFFERARDGFADLIAMADKDSSAAPSENSVLVARLQYAQSLRRLGEFSKAIDAFTAILRGRESMLDVQTAAAYTYQEWGVAENQPARIENAIFGGRKVRSTGENRIWGWLKLAQIAAQAARANAKYKDLFFEARLNVAEARYLSATLAKGADRTKLLNKAKQNVRSMVRLYPDLGGDELREQYNDLLKKIQREGGEVSPPGLREFQTTST